MPQTTTILCDQCGHDLTYTGNSIDWRLALENKRKPIRPDAGAVTDMMIYPAIKSNAYFCGVGCLSAWLRDKYPKALEEFDKLQKHRAWLAEKKAG